MPALPAQGVARAGGGGEGGVSVISHSSREIVRVEVASRRIAEVMMRSELKVTRKPSAFLEKDTDDGASRRVVSPVLRVLIRYSEGPAKGARMSNSATIQIEPESSVITSSEPEHDISTSV